MAPNATPRSGKKSPGLLLPPAVIPWRNHASQNRSITCRTPAPSFTWTDKCAGEFTRKYSMWSRFVQCTGLQRVAARPMRQLAPRDRLPRVLGPGLRGCWARSFGSWKSRH
jgi:hypothetical protein